MRQAGNIHAASDCGCGDVSLDAREAVAALGRDVARLTEIVAA
jgi:hypothetical protein